MKKPLIISLVLLWIWLAVTLSTDYYLVMDSGAAIREDDARRAPARFVTMLVQGKREIRIDKFLLVWLLLPPVLGFPILRRLFPLPPVTVPSILQRFWRRLTKPTE